MSDIDNHAPILIDAQDPANGGESDVLKHAAQIVASYVGNNTISASDLPSLIVSVHQALSGTQLVAANDEKIEDLKPAVAIRKSVTDDFIYCLEDGMKFKSLKRHLRTKYNMTPDQYREKWGLSSDYPMVAPNYAKTRSSLAKQMGLGQRSKAS